MTDLSRAVVERRSEAPDSLDFFPTPPWATRALLGVLGQIGGYVWDECNVWEGACGEGHMAEVLREQFARVHASDVHDYGCGYDVGSFIGVGADVAMWPYGSRPNWFITNPPFNEAETFLDRALDVAEDGVAFLLRLSWLATQGRYERVYSQRPPSKILQFTDRVPMVKGRWDPDASTATEYAWFVWEQALRWRAMASNLPPHAPVFWIPPGAPQRYSAPDDRARFAAWSLEPEPEPTTLDLFSLPPSGA